VAGPPEFRSHRRQGHDRGSAVTTGLPKGVVLTHRCLTTNLMQLSLLNPTLNGSCMQVVAPFYHVGATISCFIALLMDGSLYIHEDFIPDEVVRVLDEEGIGRRSSSPR
jgi:acyl-CoA synthetase (AMP-forming)/AMP-acid ligase II